MGSIPTPGIPTMNNPTVKIKMLNGDIWYYGFITIQREVDAKVMFEHSIPVVDISAFPDYWYYKNIELIIVSEEDYLKTKTEYDESRSIN